MVLGVWEEEEDWEGEGWEEARAMVCGSRGRRNGRRREFIVRFLWVDVDVSEGWLGSMRESLRR